MARRCMKRGLFLLIAVAATLALRAGPREILMVDDLTAAGSKVSSPSKDHPIVYLLVLGGYKQEGDVVAGETTLPTDDVGRRVHAALQAAGYTPLRKSSTRPPDMIILAYWGSMGPGDVDMGDGNPPVTFNEIAMVNLVAGARVENYMLGSTKRSELMTAAHQIRYFLVLSAFDYASYARGKKRTLLWQARVSAPSNGTSLPAILPSLIEKGSAIFGKPTPETVSVRVEDVPEGSVKVGIPVEVSTKPGQR